MGASTRDSMLIVICEHGSFELRVMDLRSIVKAPWGKNLDEYKSFVDFALQYVNSNVQFDKIVKANWQVDNPINYYITFEAYDPADDRTKTYQTRLVRRIPFDKSFADILWEKPPPPPPAPHCQDQDDGPASYQPMDMRCAVKRCPSSYQTIGL